MRRVIRMLGTGETWIREKVPLVLRMLIAFLLVLFHYWPGGSGDLPARLSDEIVHVLFFLILVLPELLGIAHGLLVDAYHRSHPEIREAAFKEWEERNRRERVRDAAWRAAREALGRRIGEARSLDEIRTIRADAPENAGLEQHPGIYGDICEIVAEHAQDLDEELVADLLKHGSKTRQLLARNPALPARSADIIGWTFVGLLNSADHGSTVNMGLQSARSAFHVLVKHQGWDATHEIAQRLFSYAVGDTSVEDLQRFSATARWMSRKAAVQELKFFPNWPSHWQARLDATRAQRESPVVAAEPLTFSGILSAMGVLIVCAPLLLWYCLEGIVEKIFEE